MSRDRTLLHPELQSIIKLFLKDCENSGLNVLITDCFRTKVEQDKLYSQGRTMAGSIVTNASFPLSPHNWGVAFDFCRNVKGREYDDADNFFNKVGQIGKKHGLMWGGDWKFKDNPHLEMARFMPNASTSMLIQTYGTPENFIKTWHTEQTEETEVRYKYIKDLPGTYRDAIIRLVLLGYLHGRNNPDSIEDLEIDLSEESIRILVIVSRMMEK